MEDGDSALFSQLQQLRKDPILRQYLGKEQTPTNGTISPRVSSPQPPVEDVKQDEKRVHEAVAGFQEKWRGEDEHRMQLSLRAQKAFLEAQQSIAAFREGSSGGLLQTPPRRMSGQPLSNEFLQVRCETAPLSAKQIKDETSPMYERLAHRGRTIERLQHELQRTRSHYEAEISRMREAYERLRRESAMEIADLKDHLTRFALSSGAATRDEDHCVATDAYIEAVEFKEKMLDDMHSAFEQASQEWKRSTMQTVAGMQNSVKEEIESITGRAEEMYRSLESALHSLHEQQARMNDSGMASSISSAGNSGQRLIHEVSQLMELQEESVRSHVHTVVRDAVRSRLKEIIRPIVEAELSNSFKDGEKKEKAKDKSLSSPFHKTSPLTGKDDSSPTKERYTEALAMFQRISQRNAIQGGSAVNTVTSPAALQDEVGGTRSKTFDTVQESKTRKESSTGRPTWLDKHCH